jgi:hypothetical protein
MERPSYDTKRRIPENGNRKSFKFRLIDMELRY